MKKKFYKFISVILPIVFFLIVQGCKEEPLSSLTDLIVPSKVPPTITGISPSEAIAAVSPITITGTNFSTVAEENSVFFNGKKATTISASATELRVISPLVVSDTVLVKIAVKGADVFSNVVNYKLTPASEELTKPNGDPIFTTLFVPYGISLDGQNNLYVSVAGPTPGVKKVSQTGDVVDWAPKGTETYWVSMKYSPDGIYSAKNLRGVWKLNENTPPPNNPWTATPTGSRVLDLDLDLSLNVWAVGNNNAIYMLPQSGSLKSFPFNANLRSVRVFNNALYVAGIKDNIEGVWRFPINGADLGAEELYFNYSQFDTTSKINAITFAADGDLYLGTNRKTDPVVVVKLDKSAAVLYPTVISQNTEIINFAWDKGNFLYYTRNVNPAEEVTQSVLKINMEKPGAPHYGRD